jgi:pyridoxamine-phosphate oxidase
MVGCEKNKFHTPLGAANCRNHVHGWMRSLLQSAPFAAASLPRYSNIRSAATRGCFCTSRMASHAPPIIAVTTHHQYDSPTTLAPNLVLPSPLDQFREWFKAAEENPAVVEPEAMTFSTASASGIPSSRVVLLKRVDERGFVIYTNYTSRKSRELKENPVAALTFYWKEIHRQVRVVGRVEIVAKLESEAYFKSRPVGSRIGAYASKQSTVIEEGEVQRRYHVLEERFGIQGSGADVDIPLPEFWGGWRVIPE